MKKSRIAKLALLGASTAALAATLSTSTYAWYVSNKTATVTASQGSTAAAAADGSITLSLTGAYGTFFNEIDLGSFSTAKLLPVSTSDAKTFYSLTENAAAGTAIPSTSATVASLGQTTSDTGKVYKYVFFIMSDADVTIDPTITIRNTTGANDFIPQVNYSGSGYTYTALTSAQTFAADTFYNYATHELLTVQPADWTEGYANYATRVANTSKVAGVGAGANFYCDALNAMSLSYWETTSAAEYAEGYSFGSGAATYTAFTALNNNMTTGVVRTATNFNKTSKPTGGAQDYYEEMSKLTLTANGQVDPTQAYAPASAMAFTTIGLTANTPKKLEYYLWLDGGADLCFNACEQQSFTVQFSYTVH